jgi:hypothetical protein
MDELKEDIIFSNFFKQLTDYGNSYRGEVKNGLNAVFAKKR